jgi:hypothetical protein
LNIFAAAPLELITMAFSFIIYSNSTILKDLPLNPASLTSPSPITYLSVALSILPSKSNGSSAVCSP